MTQYDKIAKEYSENQGKRTAKVYAYNPSFFKVLGNVKGKSVLDLGCGDGYYTRMIKNLGALKVVGIDLSREMIKIAKEKENANSLEITYQVKDSLNLGNIGKFDLVTAGFLLHYSKTKEELKKMIQNIFNNLKKNGRLVAINNNLENPTTKNKKYGSIVEIDLPIKEGSVVTVKLFEDEKEICSFKNYYWSKETYEKIFKEVGFKKIIWHTIKVSKEGIEKLGEEYWKDFYKTPCPVIVIEAFK